MGFCFKIFNFNFYHRREPHVHYPSPRVLYGNGTHKDGPVNFYLLFLSMYTLVNSLFRTDLDNTLMRFCFVFFFFAFSFSPFHWVCVSKAPTSLKNRDFMLKTDSLFLKVVTFFCYDVMVFYTGEY